MEVRLVSQNYTIAMSLSSKILIVFFHSSLAFLTPHTSYLTQPSQAVLIEKILPCEYAMKISYQMENLTNFAFS